MQPPRPITLDHVVLGQQIPLLVRMNTKTGHDAPGVRLGLRATGRQELQRVDALYVREGQAAEFATMTPHVSASKPNAELCTPSVVAAYVLSAS